MTNEQMQLPLEWHDPPDHYTVEVRCGPQFGEETVRTMEAKTPDEAVLAVESLRESYEQRNNVKWQAEEVNAAGHLYGMDAIHQVWVIQVVPTLPAS